MILSSAWMSWSHRVVPLTNLLPFLPNFLIDREPRRECLAVVHLFGKRDVKLAELDTDCDFEHSCSHKWMDLMVRMWKRDPKWKVFCNKLAAPFLSFFNGRCASHSLKPLCSECNVRCVCTFPLSSQTFPLLFQPSLLGLLGKWPCLVGTCRPWQGCGVILQPLQRFGVLTEEVGLGDLVTGDASTEAFSNLLSAVLKL